MTRIRVAVQAHGGHGLKQIDLSSARAGVAKGQISVDDTSDSKPGDPKPGDAHAALQRAVHGELALLLAKPLAPGLYLVATPIGHLGDITLRALSTLASVDVVYCEDTRHSRKLLDRYSLRPALRAYHEHNASEARPAMLAELARGARVALISDAGTPLISDPGYKLVRAVLAEGGRVIGIPGASATLTALVASGLPTDCFTFSGFLPVKAGARAERLAELAAAPGTLVVFEAPGRTAATLAAMAEAYGPTTPAAVGRELTKLHEEMRTGTLADLVLWANEEELRGEVVILAAPIRTGARDITDADIETALAGAASGTLRDKVDAVAASLGVPKKRVYALALASRAD
jgi:16S rRNA (cytidine1402-2'-O)-methyltransferase